MDGSWFSTGQPPTTPEKTRREAEVEPVTLVATLGGQAQVVTFALDWLFAQGEPVRDVVVVHLTPDEDRHRRAWRQIAAEFAGDKYSGRPCRLRLVPIRYPSEGDAAGERLRDIRNERDAEATWQTVYELLTTLKSRGSRLHVCVAGGRRLMGLLALSASMLLCGHDDRLWHMFTPADVLAQAQNGAVMHVDPAADVRLIQVPVVPWGSYFPVLRQIATAPQEVIAVHTARMDRVEAERCRQVIERLSDRQTEALRHLAAGLAPDEAADAMNITLATLHSHKTEILAECRIAWALPEDAHLTYHFVREKFGPLEQAGRLSRATG